MMSNIKEKAIQKFIEENMTFGFDEQTGEVYITHIGCDILGDILGKALDEDKDTKAE